MLRCSNPECESHGESHAMFTVNVTVGNEYEIAEPIRKIPYEYFICVYCNNHAERGE